MMFVTVYVRALRLIEHWCPILGVGVSRLSHPIYAEQEVCRAERPRFVASEASRGCFLLFRGTREGLFWAGAKEAELRSGGLGDLWRHGGPDWFCGF